MSDGKRGGVTGVYVTMHVADIAGVAPWEVDERSLYWTNAILTRAAIRAEGAERAAERERLKRLTQGRRR